MKLKHIGKWILVFSFILLASSSRGSGEFKLKESSNVLIYKKYLSDSLFVVQLIEKKDSLLFVRGFDVKCNLSSMKVIGGKTWDSIFTRTLKRTDVHPVYTTSYKDTLIQISDTSFFANNTVYSEKNNAYYVKFNAQRIESPYGVDDLYDIFVLDFNKRKNLVKFWSSDSGRTFSYPIYIYQRNFWFILLSRNDSLQGSYTLHYVNGQSVDLDIGELLEMF